MIAATLIVAIAVGAGDGAARYAARYTAVVFGLFILLIALGTDSRSPTGGFGAASSRSAVVLGCGRQLRTSLSSEPRQATGRGDHAAGRPGDVVGYCPDQLGPGVSRLLRRRLQQLTYPRAEPPARVRRLGRLRRPGRAAADPVAFADLLDARAGPGHDVFLVWSGAYRTHEGVCEQIVGRLVGRSRARDIRVVKDDPEAFFETRSCTASSRGEPRRPSGRRDARALAPRSLPGLGRRAPPRRGRAGVSRASWWTSSARRSRALRPGPTRACSAWDGSWYARIAEHGYAALPDESIRFFPLVPGLSRGLGAITPFDERAALVIVANASALVLGLLLYRLARLETGDAALARRSVWLLALAPPAYVFVMGYTEATAPRWRWRRFLALRTRRWGWAALAGALAGRPDPSACCSSCPPPSRRPAVGGERIRARTVAPRGRAAQRPSPAPAPTWHGCRCDSATGSCRCGCQRRGNLRGSFANPVATLDGRDRGLFDGSEVGTGLHVPWAIAARHRRGRRLSPLAARLRRVRRRHAGGRG